MGSTNSLTLLEVLLFAMLGMFLMAMSIIFFFVIYQRRLLKQQKQNQELTTNHQNSLLKASIASQEKERNRLAKDLHDDIGAMLTTIKLYTDQIDLANSEDELKHLKEKANQLVDQTLDSLRQISYNLHPVILDNLGLEEAIRNLADDLNNSNIIQLTLHCSGIPRYLPYEQSLAIYRVIQELTSNTIKHAQASNVWIDLTTTAGQLTLNYKDNGIGYHPSDSNETKGHGIKNMESRVRLLGGTIQYQQDEDATKVLIKIKLDENRRNKISSDR